MILITGDELIVDGLCSALASLGRAVTVDMVVDAVLGALDRNACGQTLDIAPPPETTWAELLARAGVTPRPVVGRRARLGRWFGAPTFDAPVTSRVPAPA